MAVLWLMDASDGVIPVRMTGERRQNVVHVLRPEPIPSRVYPIHDRRHVSTDVPQGSLPKKGTVG